MSQELCPQTPQLHFVSQFMQNTEFFLFLANTLPLMQSGRTGCSKNMSIDAFNYIDF